MANIGLVIREDIPAAFPLAEELMRWCDSHGHALVVEDRCSLDCCQAIKRRSSLGELVQSSELIVVMGGDGSFIRVARLSQSTAPIVLGVNFGTLGFLTEIQPAELLNLLPMVFDGRATIGVRNMLKVQVLRDGKQVFSGPALNDAVVQKGTNDRLLELNMAMNGKAITSVRADGLIVSTPTGSTAYSLAAGGSIAHPSLDVMLITPICPHSLTSRPFIVPLRFHVGISIPEYPGQVHVTLDGQESFELKSGDKLLIEQHEHLIRFAESPSKGYFEILREKLNWGLPNFG